MCVRACVCVCVLCVCVCVCVCVCLFQERSRHFLSIGMDVCRSEAADDDFVCVCVFLNQCAAERSHGSYGQIASSVPGESVQVVTMHS